MAINSKKEFIVVTSSFEAEKGCISATATDIISDKMNYFLLQIYVQSALLLTL